jgi:hypothetical protein
MLLRTGVIHGGQVLVDEPIDLPDGSAVTITTAALEPSDTPEAIAADLAAMAAFEPLDLTDAELAAWEADRQARKAWEKAYFFAHTDRLRGHVDAEVPPG